MTSMSLSYEATPLDPSPLSLATTVIILSYKSSYIKLSSSRHVRVSLRIKVHGWLQFQARGYKRSSTRLRCSLQPRLNMHFSLSRHRRFVFNRYASRRSGRRSESTKSLTPFPASSTVESSLYALLPQKVF